MQITLAYVNQQHQHWQELTLTPGATVQDAIEQSGMLKKFPELDSSQLKLGIFGKLTQLDSKLKDGDRIEFYRPIIADPKTVPRRR